VSVLDRFRLDGKVAIVTAASRGIGAATAIALGDAGADVAVLARSEGDLEKVAGRIRESGRRALVHVGDVTDDAVLQQLVERTVDELGGIDVVVNNAGGSVSKPFLEAKKIHFQKAFEFNVLTAFELSRLAVPRMLERGGGSIVNVASMAGVHMARGAFVYGTAKAALNQMTRNMAAELSPRIRVNAVLPGAIETDALKWFLDQQEPDVREHMHKLTPMRRNGEPEDIAAAILYLASPASSFVTGKLLEVDGAARAGLIPHDWPDL
jgi:7-alpha-hydroxysteroid dehydrogenase